LLLIMNDQRKIGAVIFLRVRRRRAFQTALLALAADQPSQNGYGSAGNGCLDTHMRSKSVSENQTATRS
jgi:hypothetical protein